MKASSLQQGRPAGFSLIELLVVMAVICILSVTMYSFGSGRRQLTAKALCQNNLQKVYIALQIYARDYKDELPETNHAATSEDVLATLVPRYSADNSIFICPGGRDPALPPGESLRDGKISYAYYMGQRLDDAAPTFVLLSDRQVNTNSKLVGDQVFSDNGKPPGNNHHKYGGNFLMSDGSAQPGQPTAGFSLVVTQGVLLLNPKP